MKGGCLAASWPIQAVRERLRRSRLHSEESHAGAGIKKGLKSMSLEFLNFLKWKRSSFRI